MAILTDNDAMIVSCFWLQLGHFKCSLILMLDLDDINLLMRKPNLRLIHVSMTNNDVDQCQIHLNISATHLVTRRLICKVIPVTAHYSIWFGLMLNVPVNNFSVMLGRSHHVLCITSIFEE